MTPYPYLPTGIPPVDGDGAPEIQAKKKPASLRASSSSTPSLKGPNVTHPCKVNYGTID